MSDPTPQDTPAAAAPTEPSPAPPADTAEIKSQADKLVAEGKKAIALKDWEGGVEKYAGALDLMRQLVGDFDPAMAPLLLSYGKALYELAFASQGVMGKEEVDKVAVGAGAASEEAGPSSSKFVFGGDEATFEDGEDAAEGEEGNAEAGPSNASGEGEGGVEGEEGAEGEEGDAAEEPEDDYNAAWEVLDVARTIYAKIVEDKPDAEAREDKLNLAETYLALGDVSLETENFPQAVQDYTSALDLKSALLPPSSRALASVHYQLATVLEFTPAGRQAAQEHVQHALAGFQARLAELNAAKTSAEDIAKMSDKERENEKKDVEALIGDLEVKIEELKQAPVGGEVDIVKEGVNHLLGGGLAAFGAALGAGSAGSAGDSGPVNDLTSMVKKKKKPAAVAVPAAVTEESKENGQNGEKRKAEDSQESETKKAKVE